MAAKATKVPSSQAAALLEILKVRYHDFQAQQGWPEWSHVERLLNAQPQKLWSLFQMEETGGEPNVLEYLSKAGEFVFCDFSAESPKGRRSLCYDQEAWTSRRENKPAGSARGWAQERGTELLSEAQYVLLQGRGQFDLKTSSWLLTSDAVRSRGGAIFGDRRYDRVFVYHNGAESYYAARAFRVCLVLGPK